MIKRLIRDYGNDIVIATTNQEKDNVLEKIGKALNVRIYRGKFNDVLSRLLGAAHLVGAEDFIRIYGNYPLVDLYQMKALLKRNIWMEHMSILIMNITMVCYVGELDVIFFKQRHWNN